MAYGGNALIRPLRGIIFDLDGTLVDSRLDFAAMRREAGISSDEGLLEHLDSLACPEQRERVASIIHQHEMRGAALATWMPGAEQFLQRLAEHKYRVGIVTRNSRPATELTVTSLRLPVLPIITREDAPPKPDPGGLLQLATRWQLPPSQLAYIGDYRYDLQAAANAGMLSVLYSSAKNIDYADQADIHFEHFDEFSEWLLGPLPPA